MTLPFALPDWVPGWAPAAILVPALLFALAFLLMPFSVFGVKGRLDAIEERLDEIQGEIRALALRLPEPGRGRAREVEPAYQPRPADPGRAGPDPLPARPPIPPAPSYPSDDEPPSRPRVVRGPVPPPAGPEREAPDRAAPDRQAWAGRAPLSARRPGIVRPGRAEPRLDWSEDE